MSNVAGTAGYAAVAERFVEASEAIDFKELHKHVQQFFPTHPGRALDIGAGSGRDAAALAAMGHAVVAVEPTTEFREAGMRLHAGSNIEWIDDALPDLAKLPVPIQPFDLILASAVWHHIDAAQRQTALQRIAGLLSPGGIFALSMRNGPAGAGTHVFPTDAGQTAEFAATCGLRVRLQLENQPSVGPGKKDVFWAWMVLQLPDHKPMA